MRIRPGSASPAPAAALLMGLALILTLPPPCGAGDRQPVVRSSLAASGLEYAGGPGPLTTPSATAGNDRGLVLAQLGPPPGPEGRPPVAPGPSGPPPRLSPGQRPPPRRRPPPPRPQDDGQGKNGPGIPSGAFPNGVQPGRNRNQDAIQGNTPLPSEAEERFLDDSLLQEPATQQPKTQPTRTTQRPVARTVPAPSDPGGTIGRQEQGPGGLLETPEMIRPGTAAWAALGSLAGFLLLFLTRRTFRNRDTGGSPPEFFQTDGPPERERQEGSPDTGSARGARRGDRTWETLTSRRRERAQGHLFRESARQAQERDARMAEEKRTRQEKRQREEERRREEENARASARARRARDAASGRPVREEHDRAWACLVLGVAEGASRREIKKAYIAGMKAYHPDQAAGLDEDVRAGFSEKAKQINVAYDILRDTKK